MNEYSNRLIKPDYVVRYTEGLKTFNNSCPSEANAALVDRMDTLSIPRDYREMC